MVRLMSGASQKPVGSLCELYAKLAAMMVQHWILRVSCWSYPDRSLLKAAQRMHSYAAMLASALGGLIELEVVISHIANCIRAGRRLNKRRNHPSTFQLLFNLTQQSLN
jgi:hypothetical protein